MTLIDLIASHAKDSYHQNGYLHIRNVAKDITLNLRNLFDHEVIELADQNSITFKELQGLIAAWGNKNQMVKDMVELTSPIFSPVVKQLTGIEHTDIDATLFWKSAINGCCTHAHQDISYRYNRPYERYELTTWLALDDCDKTTGAMSFLPGSHLEKIGERQDFLKADFNDRAQSIDWEVKAKTIAMKTGDIVVFNSRTWHSAHPFIGTGIRRGLAIRWKNKYTEKNSNIPIPRINPSKFGMDTSGGLLVEAIKQILPLQTKQKNTSPVQALKYLLIQREAIKQDLPNDFWSLVKHLHLAFLICDKNHTRAYAPNTWEPVRDTVLPILNELTQQKYRVVSDGR